MADPVFNSPITNHFGLTDVGVFANPTFADIDGDGDGDLDAFIGEQSGKTLFYRNTGTVSSAVFAPPVDPVNSPNPFGLTNVGSFASPIFADIDGDGDLDAFIGEQSGKTLFYLNAGTASNAVFVPPSIPSIALTPLA